MDIDSDRLADSWNKWERIIRKCLCCKNWLTVSTTFSEPVSPENWSFSSQNRVYQVLNTINLTCWFVNDQVTQKMLLILKNFKKGLLNFAQWSKMFFFWHFLNIKDYFSLTIVQAESQVSTRGSHDLKKTFYGSQSNKVWEPLPLGVCNKILFLEINRFWHFSYVQVSGH